MKDEKDLRARTKTFALRIIALYETLPRSGAAHVLGHQVLRSGTSVGANFREAHRARSNAEFVSKVGDSLKELEETSYWLELLTESGAVKATKLASLLDETSQLTAILTAISKKVRAPFLEFIPHPSSLILHPSSFL
jgi:four helix bundle protein